MKRGRMSGRSLGSREWSTRPHYCIVWTFIAYRYQSCGPRMDSSESGWEFCVYVVFFGSALVSATSVQFVIMKFVRITLCDSRHACFAALNKGNPRNTTDTWKQAKSVLGVVQDALNSDDLSWYWNRTCYSDPCNKVLVFKLWVGSRPHQAKS